MAESVDIGEAVRQILLDTPAVTDLVGAQIYNDMPPQGVSGSSIIYYIITEIADNCLEGAPVGKDIAVFQIEAFATSRPKSVEIRNAFRDALSGFLGVSAGVYCKISQSSGQSYLSDRALMGEGQAQFRTIQDFRVTYQSLEKVI